VGWIEEEMETQSVKSVVPNLWHVHPWGYSKIILVMEEKTKKGVKIKTRKQS
jgi:hypothetical protein